jgi:hypothetical protein
MDEPTMSTTANQRITVYVDGEPRRFFRGLKVRHAVSHEVAWRVGRAEATVQDGDGNQLDLDATLYDGERLYVKAVPDE